MPVFISLGHELGHALHSLNGVQTGETRTLEPLVGAGVNPAEYSGTLAQIVTIRGVENPLRQEHGITDRHSHHHVISLACQRIRTGELQRAYDAVDRLPGELKRPVARMLGRVDASLGARDLKGAGRGLQAALRALAAAQQQVARAQAANVPAPQTTGRGPTCSPGWFG